MPQQNESDVLDDDLEVLRFDHALWDYPHRWPHDPPGHVFLARAFNKIGRSQYGPQWRVSDWDDAAAESNWEDDWDDRHEPTFEDDEKWDADERALEQERLIFRQERAQVLQKRIVVARAIARQCELGILVTAIRPVQGGPITTLEAHYWNTELIASRFFRCDMSLAKPFESVRSSRDRCWIYITRPSLEGYLSDTVGSEGTLASGESHAEGASAVANSKTDLPKARAGRTPGSGSYERADDPLLSKMRDLINSDKAKSVRNAADQVADEAQPSSEKSKDMTKRESKVTRLSRRYKQRFGGKK